MCRAVTQIMQSGIRKGIRQGRKEGREEGLCLAAANALRNNMSYEDIQLITGFSLEKIASIAQSLKTAKA